MPVLTAIDVTGVQRFVFSSNRLRDVVAGSWLVYWSTSNDGALNGLVAKENILLAGGGNVIVKFESIDKACKFTSLYTRSLHDKVPGLEVVVVHRSFKDGGLAKVLQEIQVELARMKTERIPASPLLGLSVTAACHETGLPATGFDEKDPAVPLSKEVLKRREKSDNAGTRWASFLHKYPGFAFPLELDQLGRTYGETSLIGVVHVDGNGVGRKIAEWLSTKAENGVKDADVELEYRDWSQAIDRLGREAFQAAVDRVRQAIKETVEDDEESMRITGQPAGLDFRLTKVDDDWMLPLRPILLGGDDLTFVCDGRIALDLAETILSIFDRSTIPQLGKISACAGVAIVRGHAPFIRAYKLAESLCASAKCMLKEKNDPDCALDWHVGASRPGESVSSIREKQYRANGHQLTCRPYRLNVGKNRAESWNWLSNTLLDDLQVGLRGVRWSERRNKVKSFYKLVREGPEYVRASLDAWQVVDENLQLPQEIENGFLAESRTPLLDALELLDLHLVLKPDDRDQGNEEKL
ncbi:MAG: hypothetical protein PHT33_00260 [bacterium]|nr:hypothetical protein [bacterium]